MPPTSKATALRRPPRQLRLPMRLWPPRQRRPPAQRLPAPVNRLLPLRPSPVAEAVQEVFARLLVDAIDFFLEPLNLRLPLT